MISILIKPDKLDEYILPLINLIHQYIEICLKDFILDYDMGNFTAVDMKIDTHDLKKLVEDEFFCKKNFKNIKYFNDNYSLLKDSVLYFYELLGRNTFLNSRYPVLKNENSVSITKINIDKIEFVKKYHQFITSLMAIILVFCAEKLIMCVAFQTYINEANGIKEKYETTVNNFLNKEELCNFEQKNLLYDLIMQLHSN